ncbi:cytochrome P450 [Bisporella sp. PMI_857]|nr:cytochrome P450 [Bisporella sp. PMI_857]
MMVTSVTAATEVIQQTVLATMKPASLVSWFHPISGRLILFTMANEEWKLWRNTFNSGFSQGHILKLVPNIVHEARAYRNLLHKHAEINEMFLLDEQTLWFTMDMIGAIALESNLNSERTHNPLAVALLSQLRWRVSGRELNPFIRINPLDKRYKEHCAKLSCGEEHDSKSVVSLVLEGYLKLNSLENPSLRLDRHDTLVGTDISAAGAVVSSNPQVLNQMTYSLAVIKEAMRLFPPATEMRDGALGVNIHDDQGVVYLTNDCMPSPDDFIPERWLASQGDSLYPIILALTVREFDVRDAYGEFDRLHVAKGDRIKRVEGERVYQIEQGGAHPADRFPCRVSFLK